jgi:hypothetical protein
LVRYSEGYKPNYIFNADETGIFFNLFPSKTLATRGDKCHGGKKSKDRLTALLCANSDGSEKLALLITGKFAKPRCFKNVRALPCKYASNKNAWMTTDIFKTFFKSLAAKMGGGNRKILLFIDKCPAHPPDTDFFTILKWCFFWPIVLVICSHLTWALFTP